jgi:outer membrane protein assembly factor BamB
MKPRFSNSPGAHDLVAVTQKHKFIVVALNRKDGSIAWQRTLREEIPHEAVHRTASLASASPVTDGEHVYAYFGSRGLYCLDMTGKLIWKSELGKMRPMHAHGEGSSPALHGDTLIVNRDHEGQSILHALDKRTGEERWKVHRKEESSWTTPLIIEADGRKQVIISGSYRIRSYDLKTGKELWACAGLSKENVVATPVYGHGLIYAGSTYDNSQLFAIRPAGAVGDITGSKHVVWSLGRGAPYVPSFLLYGDSLFFAAHFQGILSRVDARTGAEQPGAFRLNGIRQVFASPLGAAGRIYIVDRNGSTIVLSDDSEPETLALNRLDDKFSASPVAVARELYLRGENFLYCIAE